jgi:HEAT repeat protein
MDSERINEMFAQTLIGDYDGDLPWKAVHDLRGMGTQEVFDRAAEWCSSDNPLKRARGADVLAQIGRTIDHPENNFPDESFSVVSAMLQREGDSLPLLSAIHALGHIGNPLAVPLIVEHHLHASADVRFAVACALGNFGDPCAVKILIALMQDVDDDVRDWATFGLGVIGDSDSPEIRDALFQRITDPNEDVREEVLVALAKRKDRRVLPFLITELNQLQVSARVKEAAEFLLGEDRREASWNSGDYAKALKRQFSL